MATKHTKGVIDLTFKDIENSDGLISSMREAVESQISSPKKKPLSDEMETLQMNTMEGTTPPSPTKEKEPEMVKAIRLSNNLLEDMDHIVNPIVDTVDASQILWLDLSFNQFSNITESAAAAFPNIKTIYMHANNITKISQLKKLKFFPNLKSLSLYGNPVEEHKHYRNYTLNMCPNLTQFDSSPVTGSERKRAEIWSQTFRNVLNREDEEEYYR